MAGADAPPGSHGPPGDDLAELVWRVGEDVEPPVRILVDGREYIAGAGPPEHTVEMTEAQLREAIAKAESGDLTAFLNAE
jgi:hypothetical protein